MEGVEIPWVPERTAPLISDTQLCKNACTLFLSLSLSHTHTHTHTHAQLWLKDQPHKSPSSLIF